MPQIEWKNIKVFFIYIYRCMFMGKTFFKQVKIDFLVREASCCSIFFSFWRLECWIRLIFLMSLCKVYLCRCVKSRCRDIARISPYGTLIQKSFLLKIFSGCNVERNSGIFCFLSKIYGIDLWLIVLI